ncbi:hypothetical protein JCM16303_006920 [Sporobolomyces ruberrimus]
MSSISTSLDLYSYLLVPSNASPVEIKNAFRSRLLELHPDRNAQLPRALEEGTGEVGIREINLAWEVLGDSDRREGYDQARKAYLDHSRSTKTNSSAYAQSISLDLFTPHYPPSPPLTLRTSDPSIPEPSREEEEDPETVYYTFPCRCSNEFRITTRELEQGVEVVGCQGCSERCRVEYEEVEEEDL